MRRDGVPLLVTGGSGFLGAALRAAAPEAAYTYHAHPPHAEAANAYPLDVRDADAVARLVERLRPAAIVHTAYTNDPTAMREVIVGGSRAVAVAAQRVGAALVHVSTDQVFDGERAPYDEDAEPAPVLPYGEAKAEAERAVRAAHASAIVARASLLYSIEPPDPRLARTAATLARGETVTLFTDEWRCPAHVADVARALLALVARLRSGESLSPVAHLVGPQPLVRRDFEIACLRALGVPVGAVRAGTIAESGVPRPRNLTLVAPRTPPEIVAGLRPLAYWLAARAAGSSS
jgi:dTDP-4-dehydrorhamnose reductase